MSWGTTGLSFIANCSNLAKDCDQKCPRLEKYLFDQTHVWLLCSLQSRKYILGYKLKKENVSLNVHPPGPK